MDSHQEAVCVHCMTSFLSPCKFCFQPLFYKVYIKFFSPSKLVTFAKVRWSAESKVLSKSSQALPGVDRFVRSDRWDHWENTTTTPSILIYAHCLQPLKMQLKIHFFSPIFALRLSLMWPPIHWEGKAPLTVTHLLLAPHEKSIFQTGKSCGPHSQVYCSTIEII